MSDLTFVASETANHSSMPDNQEMKDIADELEERFKIPDCPIG